MFRKIFLGAATVFTLVAVIPSWIVANLVCAAVERQKYKYISIGAIVEFYMKGSK